MKSKKTVLVIEAKQCASGNWSTMARILRNNDSKSFLSEMVFESDIEAIKHGYSIAGDIIERLV